MSFNAFNVSAKPTFASVYSPEFCSNIIQKKKQATFKSNVKPTQFKNAEERQMYLKNVANKCNNNVCNKNIYNNTYLFDNNKYNLQMNLVSYINMTNVNVLNTTNASLIPYGYTIDPSGQLFGNTACGINNYIDYVHALEMELT